MKYILVMALLVFSVSSIFGQTEQKTPPPNDGPTVKIITVPFSEFSVKIDQEEKEFEVRGTFTLDAKSDGINLFKEDVAIKVGDFSTTIPSGSFKQDGVRTKIRYKSVVEGVDLDVLFRVVGKASFHLKIEVEGVKMKKLLPEDVTLRIGDDGGTATAQSQ
jgi:hypothetical protein